MSTRTQMRALVDQADQSARSDVDRTVWVSSPDTHSERKLDPDLTVDQLKVTRAHVI